MKNIGNVSNILFGLHHNLTIFLDFLDLVLQMAASGGVSIKVREITSEQRDLRILNHELEHRHVHDKLEHHEQ